jgi:hypothetical protein
VNKRFSQDSEPAACVQGRKNPPPQKINNGAQCIFSL